LWAERGMDLPVTVNVSPVQLGQMDFVSTVQHVLRQTGLDPRLLKLEVTESMLMRDFERASETLRHLRALGIEVWIDVLPLLRGMVALAHNLGLRTIAEGMETEEQLEAVRSTACDQAQGFLLGRPRPAEKIVWDSVAVFDAREISCVLA
jgi:EAL domain-containing protein (putative c-di-GMP-specific phosphodiesterase class I)